MKNDQNFQKNLTEFYQANQNNTPAEGHFDKKDGFQANASRIIGKSNSMVDLKGKEFY